MAVFVEAFFAVLSLVLASIVVFMLVCHGAQCDNQLDVCRVLRNSYRGCCLGDIRDDP